jgi:hypothetical protein
MTDGPRDNLRDALEALHAAQLERVELAARCREAYRVGGLAQLLDAFETFARVASEGDAIADAVLLLAQRAVAATGHRA